MDHPVGEGEIAIGNGQRLEQLGVVVFEIVNGHFADTVTRKSTAQERYLIEYFVQGQTENAMEPKVPCQQRRHIWERSDSHNVRCFPIAYSQAPFSGALTNKSVWQS